MKRFVLIFWGFWVLTNSEAFSFMGLQKIETLVPIRGTRIEASLGQAPYRWVGKLRDSLGGNCTAFLVGRDLIATAAHCVLKSNRQDDFYIGYRDNTFVDHARVVFIWVGTTSTVTKKGQDWALGRLELEQVDPGDDNECRPAHRIQKPFRSSAAGGRNAACHRIRHTRPAI